MKGVHVLSQLDLYKSVGSSFNFFCSASVTDLLWCPSDDTSSTDDDWIVYIHANIVFDVLLMKILIKCALFTELSQPVRARK